MKFFEEVKKFMQGLATDSRIPARDKKILLVLAILIISPLDLIPDWKPTTGLIDDFIYLCFIMDYYFSVLDSTLVLSHYPWTMKSFARLRAVARGMQFFVPNFMKRRMWLYVGDPY